MKTIEEVIESFAKALKVDNYKIKEDMGHNGTITDIMFDNIEYYSYQEINYFFLNIDNEILLRNILNDISKRKEDNSNYKWVRFCKEVIRIYKLGGKGKILLSNTFQQEESDSNVVDDIFSMFGNIKGFKQ